MDKNEGLLARIDNTTDVICRPFRFVFGIQISKYSIYYISCLTFQIIKWNVKKKQVPYKFVFKKINISDSTSEPSNTSSRTNNIRTIKFDVDFKVWRVKKVPNYFYFHSLSHHVTPGLAFELLSLFIRHNIIYIIKHFSGGTFNNTSIFVFCHILIWL